MYVASSILRRFQERGEFRKLCPSKDVYESLAGYVESKRYGKDISERAKKAAWRYRKKIRWPAIETIQNLYSEYLWQTKGRQWVSTRNDFQRLIARGIKPGSIHNPHHSEAERRMLESLVPLARKRAQGTQRRKINRSDHGSNRGAARLLAGRDLRKSGKSKAGQRFESG